MSILGVYVKQPVEVEVYGIQFAEDMAVTDQITSAWQLISLNDSDPWNQEVKTTAYTALLSDDDQTLVSTSDITLPVDAPEGYRLNVANQSQNTGIFVGSIAVPARGATIVVLKNGVWIQEAKTNAVLIDAPSDQRVRVRVFGGASFETYKVQVTVSTAEDRVMQDEFIVDIGEY